MASTPLRKISKTTQKAYYELRVCENQRNDVRDPTWYTVRVMKDTDPALSKGDFIKVTGKLKADSYLNREGKPSTTLLIIAFEAVKLKSAEELLAVKEAKQEAATV